MPNDPLEEELQLRAQPEPIGDPVTNIETSNEWSAWRANLALQMYNAWRENR